MSRLRHSGTTNPVYDWTKGPAPSKDFIEGLANQWRYCGVPLAPIENNQGSATLAKKAAQAYGEDTLLRPSYEPINTLDRLGAVIQPPVGFQEPPIHIDGSSRADMPFMPVPVDPIYSDLANLSIIRDVPYYDCAMRYAGVNYCIS